MKLRTGPLSPFISSQFKMLAGLNSQHSLNLQHFLGSIHSSLSTIPFCNFSLFSRKAAHSAHHSLSASCHKTTFPGHSKNPCPSCPVSLCGFNAWHTSYRSPASFKNTNHICLLRALLQEIFLTQGSNPRSPALQADSFLSELPGIVHKGLLNSCFYLYLKFSMSWFFSFNPVDSDTNFKVSE